MVFSEAIGKEKMIWKKDDSSLFEYIFNKLSDKSDFGSDLSSLNDKEKVFMSMALFAFFSYDIFFSFP